MSELKELFDRHGCDKSSKHGYEEVYDQYFHPVRNAPLDILEIGVFKGASTKALHEYFPNATMHCVDIFKRTNPEDLDVLQEERVRWIKADSMSGCLPDRMWNSWGSGISFDFIIDDGAHYPKANLKTFRNCFPFLKKGGTYFIEDVWPLELMTPRELDNRWLKENSDRYGQLDNNAFVSEISKHNVSRHDLRGKRGIPDSYIIAVNH